MRLDTKWQLMTFSFLRTAASVSTMGQGLLFDTFPELGNDDSTCRAARIHFRLHYGHFSEVCSQLEKQLRNNADIAAITVTCTQIKAHFDTFRSHRRDMRRAAQDLDSKLETYFIRATNYTEEETIYDDYRNDPAWQGGNVDLSAMY